MKIVIKAGVILCGVILGACAATENVYDEEHDEYDYNTDVRPSDTCEIHDEPYSGSICFMDEELPAQSACSCLIEGKDVPGIVAPPPILRPGIAPRNSEAEERFSTMCNIPGGDQCTVDAPMTVGSDCSCLIGDERMGGEIQ